MTTDTALVLGSTAIRRDGDMWCLTDLWRAHGGDSNRRPAHWLRTSDAERFAEFLRETLDVRNSHITKTAKKPGGGGDTWSHWQLALAYAKWLSPAFHARVNEVYRAFKAGQLVPAQQSAAEFELIRLSLRLAPTPTSSPWTSFIKSELARLYKLTWWKPGMREPKELRSAYGYIWKIILGETVYRELKIRNPHPKKGSLHSAWLQEQRMSLARERDFSATEALIRLANNWEEFVHNMCAHFGRGPQQMVNALGQRKLPRAS